MAESTYFPHNVIFCEIWTFMLLDSRTLKKKRVHKAILKKYLVSGPRVCKHVDHPSAPKKLFLDNVTKNLFPYNISKTVHLTTLILLFTSEYVNDIYPYLINVFI